MDEVPLYFGKPCPPQVEELVPSLSSCEQSDNPTELDLVVSSSSSLSSLELSDTKVYEP